MQCCPLPPPPMTSNERGAMFNSLGCWSARQRKRTLNQRLHLPILSTPSFTQRKTGNSLHKQIKNGKQRLDGLTLVLYTVDQQCSLTLPSHPPSHSSSIINFSQLYTFSTSLSLPPLSYLYHHDGFVWNSPNNYKRPR